MLATANVIRRTRGSVRGPIVRLMSPSDLGEQLEPFVFLDLFEAGARALAGGLPVHPHSGAGRISGFTQPWRSPVARRGAARSGTERTPGVEPHAGLSRGRRSGPP